MAPVPGGGEAETGGRPGEGASEATLRKFSSFYKGFFPHSAIYLKVDFFVNYFHLKYYIFFYFAKTVCGIPFTLLTF